MAIDGVHAILYSPDAEGVRALLGDVLGLPHVDAGDGWLIFGLPPAEVAAHPSDGPPRAELYLMCADIESTVAELRAKGVETTGPVADRGWGLVTGIVLPGGGSLGLYEPRHPRP
jgi:hypothetical protein